MKEEWRAVPGYEGLYEVSNMGRVRSLDYLVRTQYGRFRRIKGRILKSGIASNGYCMVVLSKGKSKTIHRLVASVFLPNPDNLPIVNHKDEDKTNNCVNNLEWCSSKYNNNYGTLKERREKSNNYNRIAVDKFDLYGNYICTYRSISQAARAVGVKYQSICACLKNPEHKHTAGGYKWKYKTE